MATPDRKQGARIIVADDDEAQREVVREILEAEGYSVQAAESPEQTLDQLSFDPEVVMLDLHGIATPEVMSALFSLKPRPGLVLFSGESKLGAVARELGVDVGLPKPSDLTDLLLAVERAIDARDARAGGEAAPAHGA